LLLVAGDALAQQALPPSSWEKYRVADDEFSIALPTMPAMFTYHMKKRTQRYLGVYADGVVYTIYSDNEDTQKGLKNSLELYSELSGKNPKWKKIYEDVEKLVAQGMNRTEAFAKISADTGRRAGTVAANYYRVARKRAGGSLRKTRSRAGGTTRKAASGARRGTRRAASSAASDIDSIVDDLVKNVQALAEAVKANSVENKELRSRLDGVKKMLG